jgi:methylthioribulose-1-phosphate dehydratase
LASEKVKREGIHSAKLRQRVFALRLAQLAREFHGRGWALGTSGNYSAVLGEKPLRLLITSSGLDKSTVTARDFLEIDGSGKVLAGKGKPSAETVLHLAVARKRTVGCILHTHSVWSTLLSERFASQGGLRITGYEMLKGLEAVRTHEHREWLPILPNAQEIPALAAKVEEVLDREKDGHGFLLGGHGLYTWGVDVAQARRHVEIFEFLLEVVGRRKFGGAPVLEARSLKAQVENGDGSHSE